MRMEYINKTIHNNDVLTTNDKLMLYKYPEHVQ